MYFASKLYVSSLNREIHIKNINTTQQKEICKVLLNNNYYDYVNILNKILIEVTDEKKIEDLSITDKLAVLIKLRCGSIGSVVNFSFTKEDKKYNLDYNFYDTLNKIIAVTNNIRPTVITIDNISIELNTPKVYTEQYIGALLEQENITYTDIIPIFINSIKIEETVIYFKEISIHHQINLISKLPAVCVTNIQKYIDYTLNTLRDIVLYKDLDAEIKLNILNYSYFEYLKFIFREDLYNIYQSIYVLVRHTNMTPEYVENLTPIERDLYLNMRKQEQEKEGSSLRQNNDIPIPGQEPVDPLMALDAFMMEKGG